MEFPIHPTNSNPLPQTVASLREDAILHLKNSKAENTKRAYRSDWQHFSAWCAEHQLDALPASPENVVYYITFLGKTYKSSTIKRKMTSLSQRHETAGFDSPTRHPLVKGVWDGIQREIGVKEEGKQPIWLADLRRLLNTSSTDRLLDIRNRALLLIGWAGAFRRSELVSLNVEHVEFTDEGLIIHLLKSKTDQKAAGQEVALPFGSNPITCPVRSLKNWLHATGIQRGPLFLRMDRHGNVYGRLSAQSVRLVIKQMCEQVGLDPEKFGAHSLRSGFCSTAAMMGKSEQQIMKQTRHRKSDSLQRYIKQAELFEDNAAMGIGL